MTRKSLKVLGIAFAGLCWLASSTVSRAQHMDRLASDPRLSGGSISFSAHQDEPVFSLDQLIRMSPVIIRGTVISVLPPFNTNPEIPEFVETDSLIRVDQLLRGNLPDHVSNISLGQSGGKLGGWDARIIGDPLVKENERYIFFLHPDDRTKVLNTTGSPRFYAVGIHTGRVAVEAGKIRFQRDSHPQLHQHDGMSDSEFVDLLRSRFAALFPDLPKWLPDSEWKNAPWAPGAKKPN
jgi:hypothetical protein